MSKAGRSLHKALYLFLLERGVNFTHTLASDKLKNFQLFNLNEKGNIIFSFWENESLKNPIVFELCTETRRIVYPENNFSDWQSYLTDFIENKKKSYDELFVGYEISDEKFNYGSSWVKHWTKDWLKYSSQYDFEKFGDAIETKEQFNPKFQIVKRSIQRVVDMFYYNCSLVQKNTLIYVSNDKYHLRVYNCDDLKSFVKGELFFETFSSVIGNIGEGASRSDKPSLSRGTYLFSKELYKDGKDDALDKILKMANYVFDKQLEIRTLPQLSCLHLQRELRELTFVGDQDKKQSYVIDILCNVYLLSIGTCQDLYSIVPNAYKVYIMNGINKKLDKVEINRLFYVLSKHFPEIHFVVNL